MERCQCNCKWAFFIFSQGFASSIYWFSIFGWNMLPTSFSFPRRQTHNVISEGKPSCATLVSVFFRTRSNLSRLSHAQVYVDESGGRSETGDALMKDSAPWNTMKPLTFSTGMCSEVQWHQPVLSLSHHSLGRCQSCRWEADSSCNSEVKFSAPFPIRVHLKHPETSGAPGPKFNTLWLCQNSYWKWPLISWVFPLKMVIFHINHHFPMVFPWFSHEKWWIFP